MKILIGLITLTEVASQPIIFSINMLFKPKKKNPLLRKLFNNQNLQIMETKFLVFPCPLLTSDIVILKDVFESLTDLILRLDLISVLKPKFDRVRLPLVAMDLKEILNSSNPLSYRYNSYCLNMVIVKLAYHLSVLESAKDLFVSEIIVDIKSIMTTLSAILQAKYYEWQQISE